MRCDDLNGLVELKGQHRFGWHFNRATFGGDLAYRAGACTGSCADGRAFSAACNRADDGAECGAAAGEFRGSLVGAEALLSFLLPDRLC